MSKTNLGKVCITPRGAWAALTAYRVLDVVTYGGGSYLALHDLVAGVAPTDTNAWLCIAEKGAKGDTGATGKGIASVAKTGSAGLVDTYTITFTDGTTTTYTVTNGEKGDTGEEGNGIESIEKTSTVGAVDTYTITFTDGTTTTYTVTNGAVTSVDGKTGAVTLENKAEVDGYYERMAVGRADNLVDRKDQGTEQSFGFRTACGDISITDDGTAVVKEIRGKTLVWNQLVDFSKNAKSNVTVINNKTYQIAANTGFAFVDYTGIPIIDGHKFATIVDVKSNTSSVPIRVSFRGGTSQSVGIDAVTGSIRSINTASGGNTSLRVSAYGTTTEATTIVFDKIQLFDLTKMFGAGKEPSSVAEFCAIFPLDYQNNEGSMLSFNSDAIETVGFNQYDHSTGTAELLGGNQYQITGAYDELILSNGEKLTNKYARIPFIGTATAGSGSNGSGNYDKWLKINNSTVAYNEHGGVVVLEAKYRPHFVLLSKDPNADNYCGYTYSATSPSDPTVEAQFLRIITSSVVPAGYTDFISLYMINLRTGHLSMVGTPVSGAEPLVSDEWNTVKLVIDLAAGTYTTYVNGKLYAENGYISQSNSDNGYTNVKVNANNLLIAKCNKSVGAYLDPSLVSGRDYSYCDVDDIVLKDASGETIFANENFENRTSVDSAGGNYEYSSVKKETDIDENGQFTPSQTGTLTVTGGNETDTCVHLVWSGYRNGEYEPFWKNELQIPNIQDHEGNKLFPDGLRGVGTVYDVVTPSEATKKIGKIDLGTLSWAYAPDAGFTGAENVFYANLSDLPLNVGTLAPSNLLCAGYETLSARGKTGLAGYGDMTVTRDPSQASIAIRNAGFTDPVAFKEAVTGVILFYEMAEPVSVTFDNDPVTGSANIHEPLNLTYPVADFGTEKVKGWGEVDTNGVPKTTPIDAVISYSTDFTREIATMPKNYISVESLEAFAAALGYTLTKTWDETNQKYTFTLTPVEPEQQAEE